MTAETTPTTLTLREVAEHLDVHYMTAYRYVRLGMLPATQNGRTWVVRSDDLEAFKEAPPTSTPRGDADWTGRLTARMLEGDTAGAWAVTEAALASGMTTRSAYTDMIVPALRDVGERWESGELDVAREHAASQVAGRLVARLGSHMGRRGIPRGTVVIGSTATELHGLPVSIAADLIRDAGYRVLDLGVNLPPGSFADTIAQMTDVHAVAISVTTPGQQDAIADTINAIRDVSDVPIIVGGAGVTAEQARGAGADGHAETIEDAVAHFEALRSTQ